MFVSLLSLVGGLIFLMLGAASLVRGSVALALRAGLPPLLLGLTLVAFGTSAPEMAIAWRAALQGNGGVIIPNVVGSNICNILLIMGLCAVLARTGSPFGLTALRWATHMPQLVLVTLLATGAIWYFNPLPRWVGALCVVALALYTVWAYRMELKHPQPLPEEITQVKKLPAWAGALLTLGGITLLAMGSSLFLAGAITLASIYGLSNGVVGLTIIALGTTLPELLTSLMATKQRHTDVAIGNVVGSNLFNILGIMGSSAMISPLTVAPEVSNLALGVMLLATLMLTVHTRVGGYVLTRKEGLLFVATFIGYMFLLFKI
jgi:cation:H+ antiporter